MSLALLKAALADQIRDALEPGDWDFQVEPRYVHQPTPPTVDVFAGAASAREVELAGFGDIAGAYVLTVRVRSATPDTDAADDILTELLDDDSDYCLATAILDDETLGGYAMTLAFQDFSGLRVYGEPPGGFWLGFEYTIIVVAAHS